MGDRAVELLASGKTNRIICVKNGKVSDVDMEEGLAMKRGLYTQDLRVLDTMTGI